MVLLSACSSGGGDGGDSPTNPEPRANNELTPIVQTKTTETIEQLIDGKLEKRTYLIRYPKDQLEDSYPVVIFFHDAESSGELFLNQSPQLNNLIDSGEFIGIFPDAYQQRWNTSIDAGINDIEFVRSIIANFNSSKLFDTTKIYGVGISNGAELVNSIAKQTEIFTAIAPILGQQTVSTSQLPWLATTSVLQINGTADQQIPVDGGTSSSGELYLSAQQSAENWASNSYCNLTPSTRSAIWNGYNVMEYTFDNCMANSMVRHIIVEGARQLDDFSATVNLYKLIWDFFASISDYSAAGQLSKKFKILALGDSYTIGQGVCSTCGFPQQLKDRLNLEQSQEHEFSVQVIATTGWTTSDLKNAIVAQSPSNDFDLVTLLIGVNNQFQNRPFSLYETELIQLIDTAVGLVGADPEKLIIVSIPDYAFTPFGQSFNPEKISSELDRYNEFAQQYSQANKLSYVYITDITRRGLDEQNLVAGDRLHPSALAYSQFVNRIMPLALKKLSLAE